MGSMEAAIQKDLTLKELSFQTTGGLANRPPTSLKAPEDTMMNGSIRFPRGVDSMWNNKSLSMAKCLIPQNKKFLENALRKAQSMPQFREIPEEDTASSCDSLKRLEREYWAGKGSSCSRCGHRVPGVAPSSPFRTGEGSRVATAAVQAGSPQSPTPLTGFMARIKERAGERLDDDQARQLAAARAVAEKAVAAVAFPSLRALTGAAVLEGSPAAGEVPRRIPGGSPLPGSGNLGKNRSTKTPPGSGEKGRGGAGEEWQRERAPRPFSEGSGSSSSSARLRKKYAAGSPKRVVVPQMMEWSPLLLTDSWRPRGVPGPHPGKPAWIARIASEPPWATTRSEAS